MLPPHVVLAWLALDVAVGLVGGVLGASPHLTLAAWVLAMVVAVDEVSQHQL